MLYIFDLDGTLLDTIKDLAVSSNYALEQCNFPTHPINAYKTFVGNGINNLFLRALPEGKKTQENIKRIRDIFIPHYNQHNANYTMPYPGIVDLLIKLQQSGHKLAIASNKYQIATRYLADLYFPEIKFVAILGQRENVPIKPNPQIIYDILEIAQCSLSEVIYIGDSNVDIQTAHAAKVISVGVTWGFRSREELEHEQPHFIVEDPFQISRI